MHIAGVEVVLLVPGRSRQHDVGIEAGGAHAEIECHQQVELALGGALVPRHLGGSRILAAEITALYAVRGAQQVLQEVLVSLAARTQQVGAPHEHVARPVVGVVRVLAAHAQGAVGKPLGDELHRVLAGGLRLTHQLQRVRLQLRCRRQPAHALGAHVVVDHAAAKGIAVGQRRQHLVDGEFFVAPLVGVRVEETGRVHLPRRTDPVERERQRGPAGLRPQFFLPDVVRPATTRFADATAEHQHVDDAAVVHIAVVPVVHAGTDDHHRTPFGAFGVVGKLARHGDDLLARHAGDFFLPRRRVGCIGVVVGLDRLAIRTAHHAIVRRQQVEHRGDDDLSISVFTRNGDTLHRHLAHQHLVTRIVVEMRRLDTAEVREADALQFRRLAVLGHRQAQLDRSAAACLLRLQVPLPGIGTPIRSPAKTDGAVRHHHLAVGVAGERLPFGVVALPELSGKIGGTQVAVGHQQRLAIRPVALLQQHQHRQVGEAPCVVVEIGAAPLEVELAENHMPHRHRDGGIGALPRVQPQIGELGDLRIVRRDGHRLGAPIAHLGEEVRIRRARLRHVRPPGDDVAAVVPVSRLGHVGLLAPGLRARRRQIAVPVVEAHAHAADQAQVATARGVADHRHGRDRRKTDHAVGTVALDRIHIGRGDDLVHFVPARAHEATQAATALVVAPLRLVADDRLPGSHRIQTAPRLAPVAQQPGANHRVLEPVGAVQVPGIAGAARTTARLVVGHLGARARVVGLLRLPGHQPTLDVDLPGAGSGAVDAVRRAHHLVVRPTVAVGVFPAAILAGGHPVSVGETLATTGKILQTIEKMAHVEISTSSNHHSTQHGRAAPRRE